MSNVISLSVYKEEHYAELVSFELPGDQKSFTSLPEEVLETALQDVNRIPVVILKDVTPIGFFVLHKHSEYASKVGNVDAILVRAFSINFEYQGKGYAKEAMNRLPGFVHSLFSEVNEIFLAVNEKNDAARKLYEKAGFTDRGFRIEGPQGLQIIMHNSINVSSMPAKMGGAE